MGRFINESCLEYDGKLVTDAFSERRHKVLIELPPLKCIHTLSLNTGQKELILTFTILWALSRGQIDETFLIFPQKTGFDISCKLSPNGDNLHEMSKPVFWEK